MSIGKLGAGREEYYLSQVASGVEDYYLGSGEAAGVWMGSGLSSLDLAGEVDGDDLRAVLAGVAPSGGALARPGRRTPGFDLTFSAPKSVSILNALGDPTVAAEVLAGHEAAVRQAMGYLERHACFTRRGAGGTEVIATEGFLAAGFRHRTSRNGDPQLHTHVLVANLVRGVDGRWSALDGRFLYSHAKTASYLYQAALRHELTGRLGVEWTPLEHGMADIKGFERRAITAFSTRRREILDAITRRGERSANARMIATLDTRQAKSADTRSHTELAADWRDRASHIGLTPALIRGVVNRAKRDAPVHVSQSREHLLSAAGITERRSSFDRRDVLVTYCEALPAGAPVVEIERLADALLADKEVLPLHTTALAARFQQSFQRADGRAMPAPIGGQRFTTREMARAEADLVATSVARVDDGVAVAPPDVVDTAIRMSPALAEEQRTMIRQLTTSGAGVEVVIGKAGAGKTLSLDTCRLVWQATGTVVVGTALAARAAHELRVSAGIPSCTITRLAQELGRHHLPEGSVIVVDEAAMVGTRTLQWLGQIAQSNGAKLVLVGDDRQLPAIDAGGGFRALADALDPIRLDTNRRQTNPWERDALDRLASGDRTTIATYQRHGRLTVAATAHELRDRLVDDWHQARVNGVDGRMLALHRSDVDDLNRRARARLKHDGLLAGPELESRGRRFAVGDTVVGRRNDYRAGILNGTLATVIQIHHDEGTLTVQTTGGEQLRLAPTYVAAGHLDHGYALTIHKAQGATYDQTFVLGDDQLYREAGYVALSRGRDSNRLYIVDANPADEHHTLERVDGVDQVTRSMGRSHAEEPIHERVMSPDVSDSPDFF